MKITRSSNCIGIEFKNWIYITIYEEWSQFLQIKKFNWCDITFIQAQFKLDRQRGDYELRMVFLGLGFTIHIPFESAKSKDFMETLDKRVTTIKSWKTVWIPQNYNSLGKIAAIINFKRPKSYKGFYKCYLQIGD